MIDAALQVLVGVMLVVAAAFALIATIGLLRFPDVYTRMHAASKAGTLGSGVALISLAVYSQELDVVTRAIAGVVFFLLTAPVAAHLLARAAYLAGYPPCAATRIDAMAGEAPPQQQPDEDGPSA